MPDSLREFWTDFFRDREGDLTPAGLARRLKINDYDISKWKTARNGMDPFNIELVLTSGILNPDEVSRFLRVNLQHKGFTPNSFPYFGEVFAKDVPRSATAHKHILALYPFPGKSVAFFTKLLIGISRRAQQEHIYVDAPIVPIEKRASISLQTYHGTDLTNLYGVIAISCHVRGSTWLAECREANLPLVLIDDDMPPSDLREDGAGPVSYIWENMTGLQRNVKHLFHDHGCRHFRIVTIRPSEHLQAHRKVEAIVAAAHLQQIQILPQHIFTVNTYSYSEGRRIAEGYLVDDTEADAIICLQDDLAHGVIDGLARYDKRLRVTGYDNSDIAEQLGITSVDQHLVSLGELAVQEIRRLATLDKAALNDPIVPREVDTFLGPCRSSCEW